MKCSRCKQEGHRANNKKFHPVSVYVPPDSAPPSSMSILPIAQQALAPYTKNKNTGNKYEIEAILYILRQMGLTGADLEHLEPLLTEIRAHNKKAAEYIKAVAMRTRALPQGTKYLLESKCVTGIRNITQNDNEGKTGDIILILEDGTERSVSISGANCHADGQIRKCLTNPSAKRLGATPEDIAYIKRRQQQAITEYKTYMKTIYGEEEAVWPTRIPTAAAKDACSDVAKCLEERFQIQPNVKKTEIIRSLLCIDDVSKKPADYFLLVDGSTPILCRLEDCIFSKWDLSMVANGIWLDIYNENKLIGRIQVKFNNGIYHKGKTSSLSSSWNLTVNLCDLFQLSRLSTA